MDHSGQPSPFTRRRFLTVFGVAAAGLLATACGTSTPTATTTSSGTSSAAPASAAGSTAAGASTAPSTAGGSVVKVVWFAGRDPAGYNPKVVDAFNKLNTGVQIDYQ